MSGARETSRSAKAKVGSLPGDCAEETRGQLYCWAVKVDRNRKSILLDPKTVVRSPEMQIRLLFQRIEAPGFGRSDVGDTVEAHPAI